MPEYETDATRRVDPPCEKCGGDVRLLTILPRASDHPTFRIFECVSCSFINWVAEKIA
jgi:DNA-directed RNA polymerase subunit M/transcription elongation factor TFIIS